ncbi:DUF742 domain-containing protein [Kutzneria viridogrisea]|uniref:DUF742 domain-containing protein n=2 Tax=Kutzneria TaxID=43356 RepID=W5W1W8_9PSEU|nr:DUF742 domain-containing protein [Kutzneria albida]AHH95143.1 hypothetical protein KALB_1772 [Kutzneria albida DSM 43870]MBA8927499.1 hypothetical protein [Kutzneria viridogrisea]
MRDHTAPRLPDPRMIPVSQANSWFGTEPAGLPAEPASSAETRADEVLVRPFIMTGGRTTPLADDLRIETLVVATPASLSAPLRFEQRTVVQLCQRPHSLAEIGAALGVPLGVVRVLVGDLVSAGHVAVRESSADQLPVSVIERIRDLVRAL